MREQILSCLLDKRADSMFNFDFDRAVMRWSDLYITTDEHPRVTRLTRKQAKRTGAVHICDVDFNFLNKMTNKELLDIYTVLVWRATMQM